MKKPILFLALNGLFMQFNANAQQNLLPSNGNVGIGTTNPSALLEVNGNTSIKGNLRSDGAVNFSNLPVAEKLGGLSPIYVDELGSIVRIPLGGNLSGVGTKPTGLGCNNAQNPMWQNGLNSIYSPCPDVNVGIGNSSPRCRLDVTGSIYSDNLLIGTTYTNVLLGGTGSIYKNIIHGNTLISGANSILGFRSANNPITGSKNNTNGDIAIRFEDQQIGYNGCQHFVKGLSFFRPESINDNRQSGDFDLFICALPEWAGNVGVGTPFPKHKLSVEGTIGAREIIVEQKSWCDYVFEVNYPLMPLGELENYIKQHKHLPKVPSASEVAEDGLKVSEMNKVLMEKVEELTLYMIQQNKVLEAQAKRLEELEKIVKK